MVETTVWFGTGASVFFLAVVLYLWFAATRGDVRSPFYFLPPVLVSIAGTAYAGMTAATLGLLPAVVDIELIRFADWLVTTPMITYYLALLADADRTTRGVVVATNVAMIALGYVFISLSGPLQWVAFAASFALFLGLVYVFTRTFQSALVGSSQTARSLYLSLRDLTVATWAVYPVVYFLGPVGVAVIAEPDLDFAVTVLDLTAKVGLVTILLLRQYELSTFLTRDAPSATGEL
jgi:sensory rhodopsin